MIPNALMLIVKQSKMGFRKLSSVIEMTGSLFTLNRSASNLSKNEDSHGFAPDSITMDSILVEKCHLLRECFGEDANILDDAVLGDYLVIQGTSAWLNVLQEAANELSEEESEELRQDMQLLFFSVVNSALKACVTVELVDTLDETLDFIETHDFTKELFSHDFKRNHEAILRASMLNKFDLTELLYKHGFRASSALSYDYHIGKSGGSSTLDVISELDHFQAMTSTAYLMAEAKHKQLDPVRRAFNHLKTSKNLINNMTSFSNTLQNIAERLEEFTLHMLDLCNNKDQVKLFLEQNDDIDGIIIEHGSKMPRIFQALDLRHKDFVTHDNCQRVVREEFYDEQYDKFKDSSVFLRVWHGLVQVIMLPFYVLLHVVCKFKCCQRSSSNQAEHMSENNKTTFIQWFSKGLKIPVNRLIFAIACYILFLLWIMLTMLNPLDKPDERDLSPYDVLAFIWCLGYILSDLMYIFQLSKSVKNNGHPWYEDLYPRIRKGLSNGFLVYRFFSHILFFSGLVVEGLGYWFDEKLEDCPVDDPKSYPNDGLVKSGICLQGIGVTLIITHIFHILRLHLTVGSLYVAIRRCISILRTFVQSYFVQVPPFL